MNKEYFMNRLANGENMDAIGAEIAAMMNAAMAEHNARIEAEKAMAAEAEKEEAKRELIEEGAAKIFTKFYQKNAQGQLMEH